MSNKNKNGKKKKNPFSKKDKTKDKKTTLLKLSQVILVLLSFVGICLGYGYYKNTNHGYKTSEKTIKSYINAWDGGYPALIKLCFDDKSVIYNETVSQIVNERKKITNKVKIDYDNIQITENTFNNIDKLVSESGNTNITIAKTNLVEIPIIESDENNEEITTIYSYEFITYADTRAKWMIHNFRLLTTNIKDESTTLIEIGNQITGYIPIPSTWQQSISQEKSEYIIEDITYKSKNNETISLLAVKNEITRNDMIKIACDSLNEKNIPYTIDENATLGENKCTLITGVTIDGTTTNMLWIFSTPIIDNYTHYIELSCLTTNSKQYIDYISNYILR